MNVHDILQNPDEHVRFAAYLDKLGARCRRERG